jgi:hypothetical protein
MGRSVGPWYRRGRGVLVGEGRVALVIALAMVFSFFKILKTER